MDLAPPDPFRDLAHAVRAPDMPTFCRHNRLIQNCPICSREQAVEPRPLITPSSPGAGTSRPRSTRPASRATAGRGGAGPRAAAGLTVRRLRNSVDDGYRCGLAPGLKSSDEARRLAEELAFAATRLEALAQAPPGLYGEVADAARDPEERAWLAFLIAYLGPLDAKDPFATIRSARTSWASGELPSLEDVELGPRTAHEPGRGAQTLRAYRAWAERAGSQAGAYVGDAGWSAERRFARAFERLALPGLHRGARFDLLVTLGRAGLFELQAGSLELAHSDQVTVAAKRALGIGDPLLLERRAAQLAEACAVPLEALDLGFYSWEREERTGGGLQPGTEPEAGLLEHLAVTLGL